MPTAEGRFPALRMTAGGAIALRIGERAWRWKSRPAARLACRGIRGDMTKVGSGWITDAGPTSEWSLSGREKIAGVDRLCAALWIMAGGNTAERKRAAVWTLSAPTARPGARKGIRGGSVTAGSGGTKDGGGRFWR